MLKSPEKLSDYMSVYEATKARLFQQRGIPYEILGEKSGRKFPSAKAQTTVELFSTAWDVAHLLGHAITKDLSWEQIDNAITLAELQR